MKISILKKQKSKEGKIVFCFPTKVQEESMEIQENNL